MSEIFVLRVNPSFSRYWISRLLDLYSLRPGSAHLKSWSLILYISGLLSLSQVRAVSCMELIIENDQLVDKRVRGYLIFQVVPSEVSCISMPISLSLSLISSANA